MGVSLPNKCAQSGYSDLYYQILLSKLSPRQCTPLFSRHLWQSCKIANKFLTSDRRLEIKLKLSKLYNLNFKIKIINIIYHHRTPINHKYKIISQRNITRSNLQNSFFLRQPRIATRRFQKIDKVLSILEGQLSNPAANRFGRFCFSCEMPSIRRQGSALLIYSYIR